MLTAFVDDPALVTPEQMDRWTREFDNWAICDTLCFKLFDQTPHAFAMVDRWADDADEFVKRTAFALLASLALHDRKSGDEAFLDRLPLIEAAATDERNFVRKGVSCARSAARRARPCARRRGSWPGGSPRHPTRARADRQGGDEGVRQAGQGSGALHPA